MCLSVVLIQGQKVRLLKRFKNGCWKVGHTLIENSAKYLIANKS